MSRFILISSLVFGLSLTAATSNTADAQFAKPPTVAMGEVGAPDFAPAELRVAPHIRIAPRRVLDRATVRAALVQARATNLAFFRAYQKKGVFPSNTMKNGKLNVWLDDAGNFCAAATIIMASGQGDLVNQVAEQNNFIRLADVKQGPLMDWMLTSGFTQAEIAMIQEPFMPVMREPLPQGPRLAVEPMPEPEPQTIDQKRRAAEDARLVAKYKSVDRSLVKFASKSLDAATTRLMKNPTLAWQLIDSQPM